LKIPPFLGENYDAHWAGISFRRKRILDVGADVGSTASYFLEKGAETVYAVEGDPSLYRELKANAGRIKGIVPVRMWINSSEQISKLIKTYSPDVVKTDCEGCEVYLVDVPNEILVLVPEYLVEAHTEDVFNRIRRKFVQNKYEVSTFTFKTVKIVAAKAKV